MNTFNSTTLGNDIISLNTTLFNEKASILIEKNRATIKLNGNRENKVILFDESFEINDIPLNFIKITENNTIAEVILNPNSNLDKKFLRATLKDDNIFLDFIVAETYLDEVSNITLKSNFY